MYFLAGGCVKGLLPGVLGLKFVCPGVFQVQRIRQQQHRVGSERFIQDAINHPMGLLLHPGVHLVYSPLGVQVGLINSGPVILRTPAQKVRIGAQAVIHPQAPGDITFCRTLQAQIVLQQRCTAGIEGIQIHPAAQDVQKFLQSLPLGPVGTHGEAQQDAQRGDQGVFPRSPHLEEQPAPKVPQGPVRRIRRYARRRSASAIGGQRLHAAARTPGQQRHSQTRRKDAMPFHLAIPPCIFMS